MIFVSAPWNSGRAVGARPAFLREDVTAIVEFLRARQSRHDLCLFMVAVDSMLRCSDLLRLQVRDVAKPDGTIRQILKVKQQKTSAGVAPVLTKKTRAACSAWISASGKRPEDFLFTRGKNPFGAAISPGFYRRLVKSWASGIGLDPAEYSSHTLRRTKPAYMYRCGVPIADIAKLLGHKSIQSTLTYLGITIEQAQAQAIAHDLFAGRARQRLKPSAPLPSPFDHPVSEALLDALAIRVAAKLLPELQKLLSNLNKSPSEGG